jgi:hypothetical protein
MGVSAHAVLHLVLRERNGSTVPIAVTVDQVLLVGYTGRNRAAVLEHIRELEVLGVAPPPRVPAIYPVDAGLVTTGPRLVVGTAETSGEVEFYVVESALGLLVGVGSDHTDRVHEVIDVAASKSLCGKVISRQVWRLSAVADHWDRLELHAWTSQDDDRQAYQTGRLESLLAVPDLLAEVNRAGYRGDRRLVFGGTLPTLNGFVYGRRFEVELNDPVLDRALSCTYDVEIESSCARAIP